MTEIDVRKDIEDIKKIIEKKADLQGLLNVNNDLELIKSNIGDLNKSSQIQGKMVKDDLFSLEAKVK